MHPKYTSKQIARFWNKVSVAAPDECWEWQGHLQRNGYGHIKIDYVPRRAHRVSYELAFGPIPGDMCVCHSCDNRKCVNPAHLWLGTRAENNQDMFNKGRSRVVPLPGEANGSAKLSQFQVEEIRRIYAAGGITQTKLGAMFGVSHATVSQITRYDTWRRNP